MRKLNNTIVERPIAILLAMMTLTVGGCASLPSSGPTAHDIIRSQKASNSDFKFQIVNIDSSVTAELEQSDTKLDASAHRLSTLAAAKRSDLIGPGDILSISIYEVGVSLFAGQHGLNTGYDPSAHSEVFPAIVVNAEGAIALPYIGQIKVAGQTPDQVELEIEQGLRAKSQDPKALVAIRQNIANTAYVSGEVRKPGRQELTLAHERLLDAIAMAGGAVASPEDTVVRLARGGAFVEQRLATIEAQSADDLMLIPGDRVELIKRPRTYIVFGATAHVAEIPFEKSGVTLAEAIARVGGPSDVAADPASIMLFRYVGDTNSPAGQSPVVYRLNMMSASSYFLAQRIEMHDKDVIYIANADANRPAKLMNIINTLFAPFVAARTVAQ